MKFETSIPIKPHLKKYLIKRFNAHDKLVVHNRFLLGKLIIKAFSEKDRKRVINVRDISDNMTIVFDHTTDLTLSDGNVFDFNQLVEELYRKELGVFIAVHFLFGTHPERKHAILLFNDVFGINEEEIAMETLVKHYQRHPEDTQLFINQ